MSMVECPGCGTPAPVAANFCGMCGSELPGEAAAAPATAEAPTTEASEAKVAPGGIIDTADGPPGGEPEKPGRDMRSTLFMGSPVKAQVALEETRKLKPPSTSDTLLDVPSPVAEVVAEADPAATSPLGLASPEAPTPDPDPEAAEPAASEETASPAPEPASTVDRETKPIVDADRLGKKGGRPSVDQQPAEPPTVVEVPAIARPAEPLDPETSPVMPAIRAEVAQAEVAQAEAAQAEADQPEAGTPAEAPVDPSASNDAAEDPSVAETLAPGTSEAADEAGDSSIDDSSIDDSSADGSGVSDPSIEAAVGEPHLSSAGPAGQDPAWTRDKAADQAADQPSEQAPDKATEEAADKAADQVTDKATDKAPDKAPGVSPDTEPTAAPAVEAPVSAPLAAAPARKAGDEQGSNGSGQKGKFRETLWFLQSLDPEAMTSQDEEDPQVLNEQFDRNAAQTDDVDADTRAKFSLRSGAHPKPTNTQMQRAVKKLEEVQSPERSNSPLVIVAILAILGGLGAAAWFLTQGG